MYTIGILERGGGLSAFLAAHLPQALLDRASKIQTLADAEGVLGDLGKLEQVQDFSLREVDPATGAVTCAFTFPEGLFYEIISRRTGMDIGSDVELMHILTDLSQVKREYDKISDALSSAFGSDHDLPEDRYLLFSAETQETEEFFSLSESDNSIFR